MTEHKTRKADSAVGQGSSPFDAVTRPFQKGMTGVQERATGAFQAVSNGFQSAAKKAHLSRGASQEQTEAEEVDIPDVPPDSTLQNMNVIFKKQLRGVSVQEFYETVWSEGNRTKKEPFYGPWLEASGKNEVNVEAWTFADDGEKFTGGWCGERYPQKRLVNFKFTRTTHLYTGPPIAGVQHTQYCRVEDDDRCILAMTVQMDGIPFADCFNVEIRWVASRMGSSDLLIEVGLFVNFIKSTMLASKIREGTSEETKKGQLNLFANVKRVCNAEEGEALDEKSHEPETSDTFSCSPMGEFLAKVFGGRQELLSTRTDDLAVGVRGVDTKVKAIVSLLEKSTADTVVNHDELLKDVATADESLDRILSSLTK